MRQAMIGNFRGPFYSEPPRWRPAEPSTARRGLGAGRAGLGAFDWSELPKSALVGASGAGAIMLGGIMPSPLDTFLRVGGMVAVGYSVYNVFSATSAPPAPEPGKPIYGPRVMPSPENVLNLVSGEILSPKPYQDVSGFFSSTYPVKVVLRNSSGARADLLVEMDAWEKPEFLWGSGDATTGVVWGPEPVTLQPGQEFTIDVSAGRLRTPIAAVKTSMEISLVRRPSAAGERAVVMSRVPFFITRV